MPNRKRLYTLYILLCCNQRYYIGYTTDMNRRYREHCSRSAKCKYTRSFPPLCIAAQWQFDTDLSSILSLERRIKRLSHQQKKHLVAHPDQLVEISQVPESQS